MPCARASREPSAKGVARRSRLDLLGDALTQCLHDAADGAIAVGQRFGEGGVLADQPQVALGVCADAPADRLTPLVAPLDSRRVRVRKLLRQAPQFVGGGEAGRAKQRYASPKLVPKHSVSLPSKASSAPEPFRTEAIRG